MFVAAPKSIPARRDPADRTGLRRKGQEFENSLLVGNAGHAFRHADPEIDDHVRPQLERGTPCDDLPVIHPERFDAGRRDLELAAESRVVLHTVGLPVIFRPGNDDAVDENPGDLHVARVQGAAVGNALDLDNDNPAGVLCRHGNREHLERHRLALHRDVAVHVGRRAPEKRHLYGHRPVSQVLLAVKGDDFDEVFLCHRVDLPPAESRVDEGPECRRSKSSVVYGRQCRETCAR